MTHEERVPRVAKAIGEAGLRDLLEEAFDASYEGSEYAKNAVDDNLSIFAQAAITASDATTEVSMEMHSAGVQAYISYAKKFYGGKGFVSDSLLIESLVAVVLDAAVKEMR